VAIDIAAPPELVFRLARDPLRWATLLPHYSRSQLVRREPDGSVLASFVARRPLIPILGLGFPVAWRSRSWSEPEGGKLHFRHIGGATDGMEATWRIEPSTGGSRVTIEHTYRHGAGPLAAVIDRLFARPIARRTLATFGSLAEALAEGPAESAIAPTTNFPV
jgi:uncharacterized membrane protein